MERKLLVGALTGRVAPAVVDAYVAELVQRENVDPKELCFLRAGAVRAPPETVARRVALPLLGSKGWTLAVANTTTRQTTVLVGPNTEEGDDGGIDMLSWAEHMAASAPNARLDPIGVRLRLGLMLRRAPEESPQEESPQESPQALTRRVVRADLQDYRCAIADDTVDACTSELQRSVDPAHVSFARCAEVATWCAVRRIEKAPIVDAYRKEVADRMRASRCVALPVNASAHWVLLVVHPESAAFYVMDSMGATGVEAPAVDACRSLAPETCAGMRLVRVAVPQQMDGVSCGIFMLCFAEALAHSSGDAPACWEGIRVDVDAARERFAKLTMCRSV